jgi:hypothetical protein
MDGTMGAIDDPSGEPVGRTLDQLEEDLAAL